MKPSSSDPGIRKLLDTCSDLQRIQNKMSDPELEGEARTRLRRQSKRKVEQLKRDHVEEHWELRGTQEDEEQETPSWIVRLAQAIAESLEILLWVIALLVAGALLYVLLERARQTLAEQRAPERRRPLEGARPSSSPQLRSSCCVATAHGCSLVSSESCSPSRIGS